MKISVVLASYNGSKYINEQIDSILSQSFKDFELICVDDLSTDNTVNILKEYENKYPNIVFVYKNEINIGSRLTFAKGVELAQGQFIAFADQDDYWHPNKLEVLYNEIIKNDTLAFVYSNSELVDEHLDTIQTSTFGRETVFLNGKDFYQVINDNTIMGCSMLIRADFAKKSLPFPTKGFHHDWYLAIMALGFSMEIKYIDQILFKYRRHSNNQVNKKRIGSSQNTTQFRALRAYNEVASIDISKFTNLIFKSILESKKELLKNILTKKPFKAFICWYKFYALLANLGYVNKKVKKSNLRYIFYSLSWKKVVL